MSEFANLIELARQGNEGAATQLVQQFQNHVQRVAKSMLVSDAIRRRVDEEDVCQSVFAIFFDGLRDGQFAVDSPEAAKNLLSQVARNRSLKHVERQRAGKRDAHRNVNLDEQYDPPANQTTASFALIRKELQEHFQELLGEAEWYVFAQRKLDRSWSDLARELGTTPAALRMKHSRAVAEVAQKLGIELPRTD